MTIEEIFSNLVAHMQKGLQLHNQWAVLFNFLNLYGYSIWHEEHYYEENKQYRDIQTFYLNTYHKLILPQPVESVDIIPQTWYKYSKENVDINTRRNAIKELFKQWIDWETEAYNLYAKAYKDLYDLNACYAILKIAELIKEVSEELQIAKQKQINLDSCGYDMPYILDDQKNYIR